MNNSEICYINHRTVSCNGCEKQYDHPRVYLQIGELVKEVSCPYCSKKFVFKERD